jgi:RNA polymerase sigma-70 factor, ECF subfamily
MAESPSAIWSIKIVGNDGSAVAHISMAVPRDGDREWFSLHWAEAELAVTAYARAVLGGALPVDDLVQEVALIAWEDLDSFDRERPFKAWTLGIAHHRILHHWRTATRRKWITCDADVLAGLAKVAAEPEPDLDGERAALQACLAGLTGSSWKLAQLHFGEGLTPAIVAGRVGGTANNVRVALHRLRVALRACVERRLGVGSHV